MRHKEMDETALAEQLAEAEEKLARLRLGTDAEERAQRRVDDLRARLAAASRKKED